MHKVSSLLKFHLDMSHDCSIMNVHLPSLWKSIWPIARYTKVQIGIRTSALTYGNPEKALTELCPGDWLSASHSQKRTGPEGYAPIWN